MALTATNAVFGFGAQTGKGVAATSFYRHKVMNIAFGAIDDARLGPLEIGGSPFPTFPYKAGYVVGGNVAMQPRLQNSLGWLLYGAIGAVSSAGDVTGGTKQVETATVAVPTTMTAGTVVTTVTASGLTGSPLSVTTQVAAGDTTNTVAGRIRLSLQASTAIWDLFDVGGTNANISLTRKIPAADDATLNIAIANGTATGLTAAPTSVDTTAGVAGTATGLTRHVFRPDRTSTDLVKWMTMRKYIPGLDGSAAMGEYFVDCKPVGLTMQFANDQPIQARMDILGRSYAFEDPSGWTWANTYEEWQSIPVGCATGGGITFTGGGLTNETLPIVNAAVALQNVPLDVREEKVLGSPGLDDVTITERRMTINATVRWRNADLYKAILTGSTTGTEWSASPFTGKISLKVVTPNNAAPSSIPYSLEISADQIMWSLNGPLTLGAGQAVIMPFQGTVLEPVAGDYASIIVKNAVGTYSWPT